MAEGTLVVDAARSPDAVRHARAQPGQTPFRRGDADDGNVERPSLRHRIERREDHLVREIARDAEEHQRTRAGGGLSSSAHALSWTDMSFLIIGRSHGDRNKSGGNHPASRARTEPVARQHHARAADQRHARTVHRGVVGDRADVEPDDLRSRRSRAPTSTTTRFAEESAKAGRATRCSSSSRSRISARPRRCSVRSTTRPHGLDGWVSLEVSPLLANDTASTVRQAAELHARAKLPNLLIKIPGTPEGLAAIEASIAAGVPVNVTLLFSTRPVPGGGGRLHARDRATPRRRSRSARRLGRLGLHQSLGQGRDEHGADRAAQSARDRRREAHVRRLSRAARLAAVADAARKPGRSRSASCGRAPARKTPAPPTCSTSKRSPRRTRSTPSPRTRCAPLPIMAASQGRCRPTAATPKTCWVDSPRRAWTWRRWAPGCSVEGAQSFADSWNKLMRCLASKSGVLAHAGDPRRRR